MSMFLFLGVVTEEFIFTGDTILNEVSCALAILFLN